MIINSGMRTDIPAFFSKWFINRINEGFVYTRNPYNPSQVTKYLLSPDVVDVLSFCTKNPRPMLKYLDLLQPYGQYWFVTITPYGKDIEPNVPDKEAVIHDFITLSSILGKDCIGWRYDPILLTDEYTAERHISDFEKMAEMLSGYTQTCIISFVDLYEKVRKNFPELREMRSEEKLLIGKEFIRIAKRYDITIKPCCEGRELEKYGADCSGCLTKQVYEKAIGKRLNIPNMKSQRKECACLFGRDIGQYDTCPHLCRYCYANTNADAVKRNILMHDENSPFLIGNTKDTDIIHEYRQESFVDNQLNIFDYKEMLCQYYH